MIVVATFRTVDITSKVIYTDIYEKVDCIEDAKELYNTFLDRDDLYSASICGVIESTDYKPNLVNSKINFENLKEQKEVLIDMTKDTIGLEKISLYGVINLIDSIQDEAVDFGWTTESEAFNLNDKE